MANFLSGLSNLTPLVEMLNQNTMNKTGAISSLMQTQANAAQMMQTAKHQVENTQVAMQQAELKHQNDMWKVIQDTQTKIFEQTQETIQNRAKTQTKVFQNWGKTITG